MEAINSIAGLIFVGGFLVGLCTSIFTIRSYYAESLKRNIDAYKANGKIEIEKYIKIANELEEELNALKEKYK